METRMELRERLIALRVVGGAAELRFVGYWLIHVRESWCTLIMT